MSCILFTFPFKTGAYQAAKGSKGSKRVCNGHSTFVDGKITKFHPASNHSYELYHMDEVIKSNCLLENAIHYVQDMACVSLPTCSCYSFTLVVTLALHIASSITLATCTLHGNLTHYSSEECLT